jgi:hypothetical protein
VLHATTITNAASETLASSVAIPNPASSVSLLAGCITASTA